MAITGFLGGYLESQQLQQEQEMNQARLADYSSLAKEREQSYQMNQIKMQEYWQGQAASKTLAEINAEADKEAYEANADDQQSQQMHLQHLEKARASAGNNPTLSQMLGKEIESSRDRLYKTQKEQQDYLDKAKEDLGNDFSAILDSVGSDGKVPKSFVDQAVTTLQRFPGFDKNMLQGHLKDAGDSYQLDPQAVKQIKFMRNSLLGAKKVADIQYKADRLGQIKNQQEEMHNFHQELMRKWQSEASAKRDNQDRRSQADVVKDYDSDHKELENRIRDIRFDMMGLQSDFSMDNDTKAPLLKQMRDSITQLEKDKATLERSKPKRSTGLPKREKVGEDQKFSPTQQDWISRASKANPGMTQEEIIAEGKKLGKL